MRFQRAFLLLCASIISVASCERLSSNKNFLRISSEQISDTRRVRGEANDICIGNDRSIWISGIQFDGYKIYKWNTATQQYDFQSGAGPRISIDKDGKPWIIGLDSAVYSNDGTGWKFKSGHGIDIACSPTTSDIYVIGKDNVPYKWNGAGWNQIPGIQGTRIAVDIQGYPWVIDMNGKVFRGVGGQWQDQGQTATDISASANGYVFLIRQADVSYYNVGPGASWGSLPNIGGSAIAGSPESLIVFYVVDGYNNIYYYRLG